MKRRSLLLGSGGALLLGLFGPSGALSVAAVRVWPANDYTRVTIEHDSKTLAFKTSLLTSPDRLVVDLEGLQLSPMLKELVARIQPNDPFIAQVRVGQYQTNTVRLVFDLKQGIRPQVFTLEPVGLYQHRLVIDLYPTQEVDPLLAFLQSYEQDRLQSGKAAPPEEPPKQAAQAGPSETKPSPAPGGKKPTVSRLVTIALDPGHGGEDPGAVGKGGTREKDVVLRIARLLKTELDSQPGVRTYLTRDGDYFVPLGRRVEKARRVGADLMVSIHADAWVSPKAKGSSVYVLSQRGATSAAARWMAQKENSSDAIGGIKLGSGDQQLQQTLLDMSTTAQIKDSLKLGNAVLRHIKGVNELHKQQVEQAGFAVLKAPDIPSILVETAFISNPEEEKRLRDMRYQQEMARALRRGIVQYLEQNPPLSKSRLM
ncbi:MAG: AMIN domain-containing protein [Betaproteobacteria bacterium]|jgi:N-acetylmuramoyl-L-alanine amidase|nr:AMIN domain-containing protein [Betaproteobacteria bacterium]